MAIRNATPIGQKFGRLTVTGDAPRTHKYLRRVFAKCECGTVKDYQLSNLLNGITKSCGCILRDMVPANLTHGHSCGVGTSSTYQSWYAMKQRCTNPKHKKWKDYGGRGIMVCDRWLNSFENFLADMGERPGGRTLDRREVNGNYEPNNCRWATPVEQARNRRAFLIEFNGERRCLAEWAEVLGIKADILSKRISQRGWSIERAFSAPPMR